MALSDADGHPLLMIDRTGSRDRDDAFVVYPDQGTGGWTVEVHVAAVADAVPMGSGADKTASVRVQTKYLSDRTIPMLGHRIEQAATLSESAERASMRIRLSVSADGTVNDTLISRARIPSGRCRALDHHAAAAATTDPDHQLHTHMVAAERLV
ncbi:RNB domain-containing ribonuclease [Nocardia asiatica]|uniref:RNB domain-containing ribonuclease n=1 Tax=Nocardia asiatica TaxID=209252 RepID=UPI0003122F15|nr:RNB domain-containing ribonuclease [Nocardia asiatica]